MAEADAEAQVAVAAAAEAQVAAAAVALLTLLADAFQLCSRRAAATRDLAVSCLRNAAAALVCFWGSAPGAKRKWPLAVRLLELWLQAAAGSANKFNRSIDFEVDLYAFGDQKPLF